MRTHRAGAALFSLVLVVSSVVGVLAFAGTAQAAVPTFSSVTTLDTDADGKVDQLQVVFSETVQTGIEAEEFSIGSANGLGGTLDTGTGVGSDDGDDTITLTVAEGGSVDSGATPTLSYDPSAGADGSASVVSVSTSEEMAAETSPTATDGVAPVLSAASTLDRDADGKVDAATLTFAEKIDDATVTASDYSIGGQAGEAIDSLSGTNDETVQVRLTTDANEVSGTDVKDVTYTAGSTADTAGNTLASVASGDLSESDGAAPVVTSGQYRDTDGDAAVDEVDLTFSETVSYSTFNADDWSVTTNAITGLSLDSLSSGSGTSTLTFGASADADITGADGGSEPAVSYVSAGTGTVEDTASSPLEAVDGSSATLADAAKPTITGIEIKDTAGDGNVDEVVLTFSEYVDTDDGAAPAAADVGTLTLPDGSTADLSSATFTDPAGTASTVTVSGITGQSTENTAVGSTDVSGDLSADWVDASAGTNALVSTLDDETVTDSAAPVETTATYKDTSGDGTVDRIDVDHSEDVSASTAEVADYSLGGTDAGSVTVDSAAVSGSAVRIGVTTSLSSPSLTLDYDANAGTADSITDGTNAAGSFTDVSVTDDVVPELTAAETLDRDGDGNVDAANLTFSEAVLDSSVTASDYSIGGQTAEAVDTLSTADDDTIQVRITTDANEIAGTDVADVTYTAGSTTDAAGNTLGSVASGDVTETDGAAPVVTSFSLTEDTTTEELDVSFDASESLATVSVSISGPESATITSFSASGTTYTASIDVFTNGDYTATLDTADDAAGNSASSTSDTATVAFVSSGGGSAPSSLSDTSSSAHLSGATGLSEVGVTFGGAAAGTIKVSEMSSLTGSIPPGTFVSAAEVTVPASLTETSSTLKFAISRERLDELGVDASALTVFRLHDGSWDSLETRVVDQDGDTVVVEADTPGFSRFAVMAGEDASTASTTSTSGSLDEEPDETDESSTGTSTDVDGENDPSTDADGEDTMSTDADGDQTTASRTPGFGVGVVLFAFFLSVAVGLCRLD
ncbi:PGF-pre-PGF domain-containing protein [Salinigranum salinum]|uniref:PGF-pre-PGF domain-containing protein n=1 Tax=Salinigranum salinum TaxID=1364937 RepID=UPI0018643166|nr:PGF-pre-PGF domain-containing protein [Salinigranum salinum]